MSLGDKFGSKLVLRSLRWRRLSRSELRNLLVGLAFISPWLIGFLCFTLYPMLASLYYSFTDFKILESPRWVGLDNYIQMFGDPLFWKSLTNTLYLTFIGTPVAVAVALGIALLLNTKGMRGIGVFRTIFFLPVIFPVVAASILWLWLLNPPYGLVNQLLGFVGIHGPGWFYDAAWAKNGIVLMTVWGAGDVIIIYLGALQGVSRSLYEAAEIDGAGRWTRFWNVTVPMISPAILFNLITQGIAAFQSFTQAYVVSAGTSNSGSAAAIGGTQNSLLFYGLNLYNNAFRYFHMGYASALGWFLLVLILFATFGLFRLSRGRVYYEGEE
ncbi:MAG: carbohydrate ABC transporter permease [Sphingomicrobium sp.]|jgi:multiple sugar transport system permease protein